MIIDEHTLFIIQQANAQLEKTQHIDWDEVKQALFKRYHETYPADMLERLFYAERAKPKYQKREIL